MGLSGKKVDVDIDGDGVPDLKVSLKEIIIVVGGIISLVMTYTTLKYYTINRIEDAGGGKRLDKIEDKIYKR